MKTGGNATQAFLETYPNVVLLEVCLGISLTSNSLNMPADARER